ncbi:MAG TPA: NAD-dependent epimerase/dehydratase family protein [Alphaproteobacteria bacterium]|nr:NAD-dependent epimerase/dehydratase family protein [Alphaproteobacteria bacterium]
MAVLVTGAAGFIGCHVSHALLARGERVIGVDNLNDYYDVQLKKARLAALEKRNAFSFEYLDIAEKDGLGNLAKRHPDITHVVHLAAQAGVRYSLTNPGAYIYGNIQGHYAVLELCRRLDRFSHLVYASSSSVYGGNTKLPFSVEDRVDHPISLYAATKRADELMSHAYSHLFEMPATGLRFFTVYGPWGRPDMALFIFTKAIFSDEPIRLFNHGNMKRDFTYIDDIVAGVLACLDRPPRRDNGEGARHRVYNLGNHRAEELRRLVSLLEAATGKTAKIELAPMQPGDVAETYADIEATTRDLGFSPTTSIDEGVPRFVEWFRSYHKL